MTQAKLHINADRFRRDFEELSSFGAYGARGVNRPALSQAHLEARAWFLEKAGTCGLNTSIDGAGNHSARLACGPQGARTLLLGSHLDSVPTGGRYDGALGVLAALEVLRCIQEAGIPLPFDLEAIDFTDEEGTLVSFLGSFAFCGMLSVEELQNPRGGRANLERGMQRAGLTEESILAARRDPASLAGYLELHVEQGPILEADKTQIGVVDRIAGISFHRLLYLGVAGHAGTIDMDVRKDAAQGAAAFTLAARQIVMEQFPECYSNVGILELAPGFFNIIPEVATLGFEYRAAAQDQFDQLGEALLAEAHRAASNYGLGLEQEFLGERRPASMDPSIQEAIRSAANDLNLTHQTMTARAGHDAQPISAICPTGMIFVPSQRGISHSPDEYSTWDDCINGANVLLNTVRQLAEGYG